VIGFFGLIADWVDLETIRHLASARPQWSFLLIGRVQTDTSALRGLANVHLLGAGRSFMPLTRSPTQVLGAVGKLPLEKLI